MVSVWDDACERVKKSAIKIEMCDETLMQERESR